MTEEDTEGDTDTVTGARITRQLDTTNTTPSSEVVSVIADLEDNSPAELTPIYDTVDHLLQHLFENPPSPESQARVEFHYEGYQITVHHKGNATFLKL